VTSKNRSVITKIEVLETTSGQVLVKMVQWLQKLCIGDYKNVAFCSVTLDSTLRPLQGRSYWWKWYTVTTKTLYWGLQKCCILWCDIGLNLQVFSEMWWQFFSSVLGTWRECCQSVTRAPTRSCEEMWQEPKRCPQILVGVTMLEIQDRGRLECKVLVVELAKCARIFQSPLETRK